MKERTKELTTQRSMNDFKQAYEAKKRLIEREKDDFLYALGKQWSSEDVETLKKAGVKPVTDNRIQPNISLLTGLERQNRSDFKAFPEGAEDDLKAEIASALFKHAIKVSDFGPKSSDQFKDGITCGESYLELYLDNTENLINGKPCWKKLDGSCVFPDPASREYDMSDAKYVYKVTRGLCEDDIVSLYPEKEELIVSTSGAKINFTDDETTHVQKKDYATTGGDISGMPEEKEYDLVERYYKKWVKHYFIGDRETGEIKEARDKEAAQSFVENYKQQIEQNAQTFLAAKAEHEARVMAGDVLPQPPIPPPPSNTERFTIIERKVAEIWVFAHLPGVDEPLADEKAWFYPKWKNYHIIPYFARFSTAPLTGDDRHLLVQGVVHGVKDAQDRHNRASTLMVRHLNTATNSGWLAEEDSWVNRDDVRNFGSAPGVNLEYKPGKPKPERIFPMPLSQGHAALTAESAEDIKSELGINSDLLAAQEGGSQSGRAIALRQRQGLLMVQEFFDNLSRTRQLAGRFLLSQLGEIYDTETTVKVLGNAFLEKNFPPLMLLEEGTGALSPMKDEDGAPMRYDKDMAQVAIAEVLGGELGKYDVSVGEAVSSETIRMAQMAELQEFATAYPGMIPPDVVVEMSQLPNNVKERIVQRIKQAQAAQQVALAGPVASPAKPGGNNAPEGLA